eukprot:CAMPEP_0117587052 /NCGR_PEP_ID=MMETSP0784-20121206/69065_1 /TAXON_ID=39447 /ORGANISM="" /LENGTH=353 /DNA_ID=CAMNT_0005388225 /DNA_START=42 /DNA_END=1103 /DNA_ORIENTATION=+
MAAAVGVGVHCLLNIGSVGTLSWRGGRWQRGRDLRRCGSAARCCHGEAAPPAALTEVAAAVKPMVAVNWKAAGAAAGVAAVAMSLTARAAAAGAVNGGCISRPRRSYTIAELKARLRAKGLPVSGKKADLLARLDAAEGEQALRAPVGGDQDAPDALEGLTVVQLKARLRERGLAVNGRKAQLVARLLCDATPSTDVGPVCGPMPRPIIGLSDVDGERGRRCGGTLTPSSLRQAVRGATLEVKEGIEPFNVTWEPARPPMVDLSGFMAVPAHLWMLGTVRAVLSFGAFVEVDPPNDGPAQWGLLVGRSGDLAAMGNETEYQIGQELMVRVACMDVFNGRLGFSAREDVAAEED